MNTDNKSKNKPDVPEDQIESGTDAGQEAPGLDLNDLAIALQLIEAAIQRGAYQPRELAVVGETHGRIQSFLEFQAKLQSAANSADNKGESN